MGKEISYFRKIRVISCIAIVFLHTFYLAVSGYETTFIQNVVSMMVRNSLLWAVPCFVMVSGALLLDPQKEITLGKIRQKYLFRVLIALVVCTGVFCLFDSLVNQGPWGLSFLKDWLWKIWTNGSWPHMWYLYLLIALYLMVPLYRLVTKTEKDGLLRYVLLLFFCFLSVLPSLASATGQTSGFYLLSYTVYPFYFFMGYALHTGKIRLKRTAAIGFILLGWVCLLLLTYGSIRLQSDRMRSMAGNYSFVAVALQAIGLFSLFRPSGENRIEAGERIWQAVDAHSFGIYLFHLLFLNLAYRVMHLNPYSYKAWPLVLLLVSGFAFFGSWALTWLLKKLPGSNRWL